MWRAIIFFAGWNLARGDEQMLLQQGLGVVSSVEFQRAVDSLDAELAASATPEAPLIRSLIAQIRSSSELTPGVSSKIDDVIELIDLILALFVEKKQADESLLSGVNSEITNCEGQGSVTAEGTDAETDRGAHITCREQEQAAMNTESTDCQSVSGFLTTLANGLGKFCQPSALNEDQHLLEMSANGGAEAAVPPFSGPFYQWLSDGVTDFESWHTTVNDFWPDCKQSRQDLTDKRQECDNKQSEYVTSVCDLWTAAKTVCENRAACYTTHTEIHANTTIPAIQPTAERRLAEAAILRFAKCLLENIQKGQNDPNECQIERASADTQANINSTYGVVYPNVLSMLPCDESELVDMASTSPFGAPGDSSTGFNDYMIHLSSIPLTDPFWSDPDVLTTVSPCP